MANSLAEERSTRLSLTPGHLVTYRKHVYFLLRPTILRSYGECPVAACAVAFLAPGSRAAHDTFPEGVSKGGVASVPVLTRPFRLAPRDTRPAPNGGGASGKDVLDA